MSRVSKKVMVGDIAMGGGAPVTIQSMTNVPASDPEGTTAQILALEKAGCEIVRMAVPTEEDAAIFAYARAHGCKAPTVLPACLTRSGQFLSYIPSSSQSPAPEASGKKTCGTCLRRISPSNPKCSVTVIPVRSPHCLLDMKILSFDTVLFIKSYPVHYGAVCSLSYVPL